MTNPDTSAEAVAKVLSLATQGKPVQFNPQFCEEAKGAKAHDWDTSHDLSVIRADGSRYKIGHFRHADDALFDQLARELVPALSRDLEAMRAERDAAIARAEQAETRVVELEARVVELEAERAEIGKASVALLDELVAYLSQNAPAHKEALAGLKTARATLSQEDKE